MYKISQGFISSGSTPVTIPRPGGAARGPAGVWEQERTGSSGSWRTPAATWEDERPSRGCCWGRGVSRRGTVRVGSYSDLC